MKKSCIHVQHKIRQRSHSLNTNLCQSIATGECKDAFGKEAGTFIYPLIWPGVSCLHTSLLNPVFQLWLSHAISSFTLYGHKGTSELTSFIGVFYTLKYCKTCSQSCFFFLFITLNKIVSFKFSSV